MGTLTNVQRFTDIFDVVIQRGDPVAFNPPKWKGLAKGTVTGFSNKQVQIKFLDTRYKQNRITSCYPKDLVVDVITRAMEVLDE